MGVYIYESLGTSMLVCESVVVCVYVSIPINVGRGCVCVRMLTF